MNDYVVTNLLTAVKDPSRRRWMSAAPSMFADLQASVAAHGHRLVILHDCLYLDSDEHTSYIRASPGGNPYFSRWRNIARWLRRHDSVRNVWCVDATDVVMLHDPFPHMRPGVVYSGSEPRPLGGSTPEHRWLHEHHPSRANFYAAHPDRAFMNPGILGGSAADVLAACEALAVDTGDLTDMGAWQQIAHDLFDGRIVTGHPVHTEYKAYQLDDPEAWWAHK